MFKTTWNDCFPVCRVLNMSEMSSKWLQFTYSLSQQHWDIYDVQQYCVSFWHSKKLAKVISAAQSTETAVELI